jgi:hypothetical protein
LIDGNIIIYATAAGLVLLFVWLMFRIAQFRKRRNEIDEKAKEISGLESRKAEGRSKPSADRSVMEPPTVGLLLIMHKAGTSPARGMFLSAVEKGRAGLIMTPEDPSDMPIPPSVKRIWLSRSSTKNGMDNTVIVNPTNLSGALDEIATFASDAGGHNVVLLDRFEEVITGNELPRVMKFLSMLRERTARDRMAVLVPVGYKATPQRTRNQMMEAFQTVVV